MPIEVTDLGVWRVEGSRVTVDAILHEFWRGSTPEQIQDDYPTVSLASIYAVISYGLRHPREVETYLARQRAISAEVVDEDGKDPRATALRARLRTIRDARANQGSGG